MQSEETRDVGSSNLTNHTSDQLGSDQSHALTRVPLGPVRALHHHAEVFDWSLRRDLVHPRGRQAVDGDAHAFREHRQLEATTITECSLNVH